MSGPQRICGFSWILIMRSGLFPVKRFKKILIAPIFILDITGYFNADYLNRGKSKNIRKPKYTRKPNYTRQKNSGMSRYCSGFAILFFLLFCCSSPRTVENLPVSAWLVKPFCHKIRWLVCSIGVARACHVYFYPCVRSISNHA